MIKPIWWKNSKVYLINQALLPQKEKIIVCSDYEQVARCIEKMNIRGAPAIGIAGAYGVLLGTQKIKTNDKEIFLKKLNSVANCLKKTRPTGRNLFWAVDRMLNVAKKGRDSIEKIKKTLQKEAIKIQEEDISMNKKIGENGAKLIKKKSNALTHCNAGSLATGGYGTALGVIKTAYRRGKIRNVFVDETRPRLQGARLTCWELKKEKIPYTLITDNMAGYLMKKGEIDFIIVGADRITKNFDVANKIGTYSLAVLANYHKIPFYVAAPSSTFDFKIKSGKKIKIEERNTKEVLEIRGRKISPKGTEAINPAFDITPNHLIKAIITEKGIIKPTFSQITQKLR